MASIPQPTTEPTPSAQPSRFDPIEAWRSAFAWGERLGAPWPGMPLAQQAFDYCVDTWQRSVLFLDVLRQRGNNYVAHSAEQVPNVLNFKFELVMSGRDLDRPVNYGLVRIVPPAGVTTDPKKRPFIVFDPRAGHGPGIGGMKHDSEIGVALGAGHPCYFVGFTPEPMPGQTVGDVCRAEAQFVEKVAALHPEAEGKPVLIGNCQAGWQIMIMAAARPDLVGPIMLAGSPLSYWSGVHGKNPMRYLGGMLGGTWLTSLAGDLGNGIFDGAYLVGNFEDLDPANTYWKKNYNVYAKIDTEPPRFLEFEKWWGSPVLLNAVEMQAIADELFVGNKLSSGEIYTAEGVRIDLRNIKSPIIVFCSQGDNITPPQQALGWILDLYDDDKEIVTNGQTIIYALHQTIGHLGIFVSAKVATKEHEEFAQAMDIIDVLPPGLYEAVMTEKGPETAHAELVSGNYVMRLEARKLADIRALGGNDAEDDRRFATVARVSEINQGLYRMFMRPLVRMMTNETTAELSRRLNPHRVRFEAFSDRNPLLRPIAALADAVRADRRPVSADNPFLAAQEAISKQIIEALDRYRDMRDFWTETVFLSVYASPPIQALVGLGADFAIARQHIGRDMARETAAARAAEELEAHMGRGGLPEATLRALIYIGRGREHVFVDERGFAILRHFRAGRPESEQMSLSSFKDLVKEQYFMLRLDEERAVAAIPHLLRGTTPEQRAMALELIGRVTAVVGETTDEIKRRLARVESLFAPVATPAEPAWSVAAAEPAPPSRRRARAETDEQAAQKRKEQASGA
jgi:pimeloyl-ACP methyl ester carboxylesterase